MILVELFKLPTTAATLKSLGASRDFKDFLNSEDSKDSEPATDIDTDVQEEEEPPVSEDDYMSMLAKRMNKG